MKKLTRSQTDRKLAGVCAGLGTYFGIDATVVRLAVIVLGFLTAFFPIAACYIVATMIIPNESDVF